MTGYNLNTPAWLWEAYKETFSKSRTLEEPLHDHMATRVADEPGIDPEVRQRAEVFLGVEDVAELGSETSARADGRGGTR